MLRIVGLTLLFGLVATAALAQSQQPYAGLQSRPIKALSDDQLRDLREGRGMGLALAAELNGYPGPMHVLELADAIYLTTHQRAQVEKLVGVMKSEAVALGNKLIAQEADLERQFATRSITRTSLSAAMLGIATTQGALRETHLKYHLATVALLSPEQIRRYSELRGYGASGAQHRPGGHPHRSH
jgi:Spy/CpxP family protein refolding chaperone